MMKKMKSICPLDCPDSCGLEVTVADGRVVSITGDKDHPYTNGFICRKMRRYPERLYGAERVLYPMVRTGRKGTGDFKRIGWDEALGIAAEKLLEIKNRYGGDTILPYSYAGNMGAVNRFAGYPLFHKLGTLQLDQTICSAAAGAGWKKQCGTMPGCPPENAADSKLIVAWGINIKVSNVHFWQYVRKAQKNGAALLVIDPYRNETAKSADHYVQVRPGGDSCLALGILKVLTEKDLLDIPFIEKHTTGFVELKGYLQATELSILSAECGVSEQQIVALADLLSQTPSTFFRIGIGLSRNSGGGMSVRVITALAAGLGLFSGGKGKGVLLSSGAFRGDVALLSYPSLQESETATVNMIHLGHALKTLQPALRALVVYNANPLSVAPDGSVVRDGFLREDIFTIVHEQVMTPTAKCADLLLPATTFLENLDIYTAYGHFYGGVAKPVIGAVGEAKSNFDFFQALAQKMGFDDPPFQETCEQRLEKYLLSMGEIPDEMDINEIMGGKLVHSTRAYPDGDVAEKSGEKYRFAVTDSPGEVQVPSIPGGGEFKDPDLQSRFPLKLITPPHLDLLNSTFGELYRNTIGELLVNPEDAQFYGISEGDCVEIYNNRGTTFRKVKVTDDTAHGVVVAEGLYWQVESDEIQGGLLAGINDLTSQKMTDIGGGATFHECLVAIRRAPIDLTDL
jgi:anaerobic selenocysteine-containing dehydrogenase